MPTEQELQDQAYQALKSKFPKRYRVDAQVYLKGLLKAFAVGDGYINMLIRQVRDNLFAGKAEGKYSDAVGARYGVVRSQGSGISDETFQKIIPVVGMSPKQVTHTLQKLLDVVYGPYATAANLTASVPQPYRMLDGGDLILKVDGLTKTVEFDSNDADDLNAVTAEELAAAITSKTDGSVIGSVITDSITGKMFLNVRTKTIGTQGFIQVLGGDLQTSLKMAVARDTVADTPEWAVTRYSTKDEMQFTLTAPGGADDPLLIAAGVRVGDLLTVRYDSGFALANVGTFPITAVGADFFRVTNNEGVVETVIPTNDDDLTFYSSDASNILLYRRTATIMETSPGEHTVILPVTIPVVARTLRGAHHFRGGYNRAVSATSSTLTLDGVTGFTATGEIRKQTARNVAKSSVSSVTSNTIVLVSSGGFPTKGSVYSPVSKTFYFYSGISGNALTGVTPNPTAAVVSIVGSSAKYSERYKYTGITGNTLTGVFPNPVSLISFDVAFAKTVINTSQPGSFIFHPQATKTLHKETTTIVSDIVQGEASTFLRVTDCSGFPDTGYIVFEAMTDAEEGPIEYLSKIGSTALIINPSTPFSKNHLAGTGLRRASLGGYTPRVDGSDYPVFVTSTAPARELIETYITALCKAGVVINFDILVPEFKWSIPQALHASSPTATEL